MPAAIPAGALEIDFSFWHGFPPFYGGQTRINTENFSRSARSALI
jgi:hypothetical protein